MDAEVIKAVFFMSKNSSKSPLAVRDTYRRPPKTGPEIIPHVYEVDTNAMYSPRFSGNAVSATIAKLKTPTTAPENP